MVLGSLIAAGGSLIGGAANASKARKSGRHDRARFLGSVDQSELFQLLQFAQAKDVLGDSKDILGSSYDKAKSEFSRAFDGQKQGIIDREQEDIGAATQSLVNRGLGNTSYLESARRGIGRRTSRALQEITDRIAGGMAQLEVGKGNALAGLNSDLIQLLLLEGQAVANERGKKTAYYGSQQHVPAGLDLSGLGAALDKLPFPGFGGK